ncbi:MAG: hypothetical protein HY544_05340 [Candidatus Diapherotrites archaeon]|uniref:ATP-grasp domain-containing protein n=1 Tax=Candidatus Iainarchaeum sp. TaxID=3101447 RepID=A0A8T3YLH2_9ARCH|nr:hypothetical protein [Candidatus Diapherotrites archaeon]
MGTLIIAEKTNEDFEKLLSALRARGLEASFLEISQAGLFIENNLAGAIKGEGLFDGHDSVFLSVPPKFTMFAEPFLHSLADLGVYCQLKPSSFYIISSKPFLCHALNSKGVPVPRSDILGERETIDSSAKEIGYPMMLRTFSGLAKTSSVFIESERSLVSFVKSIPRETDAITLHEYLAGDVDQSLVAGDEVLTVKRNWVEKELSHSRKGVYTNLSEQDRETAIRAARVCGADICMVKMVVGKVIGIKTEIDFGVFSSALGQDVHGRIADHYREKVR